MGCEQCAVWKLSCDGCKSPFKTANVSDSPELACYVAPSYARLKNRILETMEEEGHVVIEHIETLKKYEEFYSSVSCLFAEGVEFMTKQEIYDAIKKDWQKTQAT